MRVYDVIVLGLGGMGSAALYHLAKRGLAVLGIEQFSIAHDRGSSHGQTRIIRKAYFEHPAYVPLVTRSYELWHALEREADRRLVQRTGLLLVGRGDGVLIPGVRRAANEHSLPIHDLTCDDVRGRFPGFMPGENMEALFEPDAGYLWVEECVRTHVEQAIRLGATVNTGERVESWSVNTDDVTIRTKEQAYTARGLVICGGPWSALLLAEMGLPLTVRRKPVFWFAAKDATYGLERGCPVFAFENAEGFFYGFPALDADGVKAAEHSGGETVAGPDGLDRTVRDAEASRVRAFITEHLPSLSTRLVKSSVCMYTMTPDEHFIVDRHPSRRHVVYAAGFSGHGFKFAPIIGSVLADLLILGRTDEPVDFLTAARFMPAR